MKLTLRFLVLIGALLLAVGVCERQGALALDRLERALEQVVHSDMERVFAITHVRRLFRSMIVLEGEYLLARTDAERLAMDRKMASLAVEQLEQIEKYAGLMPTEDAPAMANIRAVRGRWIERDRLVRELAKRDHDAALEESRLHVKDPVNWESVIGTLVKLSEKRLTQQVAQTNVIYSAAKSTLSAVALLAMSVTAGLGLLVFLGIRRNIGDVVKLNANLEQLVQTRTEALAQRERSLQLVLDSTGDAFIELDRRGQVDGECSAMALNWFGRPSGALTGGQYLFSDDPTGCEQFDLAYQQLTEDILPWELTVDQMPRRIKSRDVVLDLDYRQVQVDGQLVKILVIARDVTARVQAEQLEQHAREQQSLLSKLLADKAGFAQFVNDGETLIAGLATDQEFETARRSVHTLKGNAAVFGLASVASCCHRLEDGMTQSGESPGTADIADLAALWRTKMQSIEEFLAGSRHDVLEVEPAEHQHLVESLLQRRDYVEILSMVEVWSWYRTSERLARLRAQTEYVAKRLGKAVDIVIEHNDLRVPNTYLDKFWSTLVHVVRNAVDHGVEPADVRTAHGKQAKATIALRSYYRDDLLVIEISDDGAGIDRDAILRAATSRGIAVCADVAIEHLVFVDGISSRSVVTDTSGRGIGLCAVRHACESEGGTVQVVSEIGKGTAFQFCFQRPIVKTGALAAKLDKRWSLMPRDGQPGHDYGSQTQRRMPELVASKG